MNENKYQEDLDKSNDNTSNIEFVTPDKHQKVNATAKNFNFADSNDKELQYESTA